MESTFLALMYLAEKYGRVYPSLVGLGHLALCCKDSVVDALAELEKLGFVTRIRRLKQVDTALGFKTVQATNAYLVHEPTSGCRPHGMRYQGVAWQRRGGGFGGRRRIGFQLRQH